jgi:tRNA threonylcarbamoyladenosine biosynthesis protein TsaB
MSRLLAIDTSGDACSAAVCVDGRVLQVLERAPRRHGELILGMMQQVLDEAGLALSDLQAIAFGCGPGSFTGLRIAAAVAQGAGFGAGLPLVPVSTLAAIAQGQHRRGGQRRLMVALDARMDEVYWGCFEIDASGLAVSRCAEAVCPATRVEVPAGGDWMGVGPGWSAYADALSLRTGIDPATVTSDVLCEARDVAALALGAFAAGRQVPPERAAPVYLRDQVTRVG